jgi:hypothetical protein
MSDDDCICSSPARAPGDSDEIAEVAAALR